MTRLLVYLSKFINLDAIILVVFQRSAFNLTFGESDGMTIPWDHHDLHEVYNHQFNVNFNIENYWQRRPYQTKLVQYDPDVHQKIEKPSTSPPRGLSSKSSHRNPQPQGYHVRDLKRSFEKALQIAAAGSYYKTPKLETATLTWIYTGFSKGPSPLTVDN